MTTLELKITTQSPTIPGSGEGFGSIVDTDVVYDELGIPYLPGKRIKGLLRDAGLDVITMLNSMNGHLDFTDNVIEELFGEEGAANSHSLRLSNLYPVEYDRMREWVKWMAFKYPDLVNQKSVLEFYTETRAQTAIDDNTHTAREHSLRMQRAIRKGFSFSGTITRREFTDYQKQFLAGCIAELRHIGTNRTRGFGLIHCELNENGQEISLTPLLKATLGGAE